MSVDGSEYLFNLNGLIDSLYASLLTATIFGVIKVVSYRIFQDIHYMYS